MPASSQLPVYESEFETEEVLMLKAFVIRDLVSNSLLHYSIVGCRQWYFSRHNHVFQFMGSCWLKVKTWIYSSLHLLTVSFVTAAGAVYLKNMILHHWMSSGDAAAAEFIIHDSDKNIIRDNIVDAVIVSESLVRWMR